MAYLLGKKFIKRIGDKTIEKLPGGSLQQLLNNELRSLSLLCNDYLFMAH